MSITTACVTDRRSRQSAGANRIRGIGSANISMGNFGTSGRVPIDPINIDGIEISRGPNANFSDWAARAR